jgi:predicted nuclease of predicted toxin-antitoxin system
MRFLVDEDLPRSTDDLLRRYGHQAVDVRDIGLQGVKDPQIASYARSEGLCLVTGDFDFSAIRNYPPGEYAGLVVLKLPRTATASFILNLLESLLQQKDLVAEIPGNLAIVEPGRVRMRMAQEEVPDFT